MYPGAVCSLPQEPYDITPPTNTKKRKLQEGGAKIARGSATYPQAAIAS